jgi:hypothetical protein
MDTAPGATALEGLLTCASGVRANHLVEATRCVPGPLSLLGPARCCPRTCRVELDSFLLSLEAENLAPKTRRTYGDAVELLGRFLAGRGMPTDPSVIRREHVEVFMADQVARWRPNMARNRYLALRRFFAWLLDEGLVAESPMARTRPPGSRRSPSSWSPKRRSTRSCGSAQGRRSPTGGTRRSCGSCSTPAPVGARWRH